MLVRGNLDVDGTPETRAALCRCGESTNQPYCDRSGACRDWRYKSQESSRSQ
jgi:CDGSH-type Zn-finger protein